jgi:hypothetical protein
MPRSRSPLLAAALALGPLGLGLGLTLAACGSASTAGTTTQTAASATTTAAVTTSAATTTSTPAPVTPIGDLTAAERPVASAFPAVGGRSLQELAKTIKGGAVSLGAATPTFTPGTDRFAFGLNASSGAYIYSPTAIYLATSASAKDVEGPFPAAADPMGVAPQYRSKQNSGPGGIEAIYEVNLPLPHAGTYYVLSMTKAAHGYYGGTGEIAVAASSPIPGVGQRPPDISTLTSADAAISTLTTRIPPENMHSVSFSSVLGKRPIALLISTPQLCISRVCGPVTDIIVSLQREFASKLAFIHQEVYVDNDPSKGLRPQLHAFHLETEPWLFVINRRGVITARLAGAFGVNAARAALQSALS